MCVKINLIVTKQSYLYKKMKRFLTLALIGVCFELYGQYLPNNSQAFQFSPILNPGFSGIENFNDMKLSYRYQWTSFGEFSPTFINLSYNTRIKKPVDLSYNSLRISNSAVMNVPRSKRIIHGLAGHLFQSTVGVIESLGAGVTYAFHYPVIREFRISFGVSAFAENRKLDLQEVTLRDPDNDAFYNHLLNSSTSQTDLNVRAGLLFYTPDFYFGLSYLPIYYESVQSSDLAFEEPFYLGTAVLGYAFQVNPQFVLKPSASALVQADYAIVYDLALKAYIQEKVWAGVTYRSVETGVGMIGFNFNERFGVSYAYEMSFGEFQQFSGSSHELVLGARLKNIRKQSQYTW